jgi:hypothetical protein
MHINLLQESLKEGNHFVDPDKMEDKIQEVEWDGVDWINLSQDREQWRTL